MIHFKLVRTSFFVLFIFTVDSFTNKAQFDTGFSERLTMLCWLYWFHSTQVWVTVFITWSLLLCLSLQIVWYIAWYEHLWVFDLKHSSVHLGRMLAVKHTQLLANHTGGHLLPSLQATTSIQTERSDEGGQNRTENSLLHLNDYVFWCKNIDNIIIGPQRMVQ